MKKFLGLNISQMKVAPKPLNAMDGDTSGITFVDELNADIRKLNRAGMELKAADGQLPGITEFMRDYGNPQSLGDMPRDSYMGIVSTLYSAYKDGFSGIGL